MGMARDWVMVSAKCWPRAVTSLFRSPHSPIWGMSRLKYSRMRTEPLYQFSPSGPLFSCRLMTHEQSS